MTYSIEQLIDSLEEEIKMLSTFPENTQLLYNIGSKYNALYSVFNEYEYLTRSINYLTKLVNIDSNHFDGLRLLASAFSQCLNTQRFPIENEIELNHSIVLVLRKAIKLQPDSLDCLAMLAPTLGYLGELTSNVELLKESIDISERALKIDPNDYENRVVYNENIEKIKRFTNQ